MLNSKFVNDILDLLLDSDEEGKTVRPQLNYLSESSFEYTGSGVFINFLKEEGIVKYKAIKNNLVLDGVTIKSPELLDSASAILFFKEGIIDYLEIFSSDGNYPEIELSNYLLTQEWQGSSKRKISRNLKDE